MRRGYVRIPTAGPLSTREKVLYWLASIGMAVICIILICTRRSTPMDWKWFLGIGAGVVCALMFPIWQGVEFYEDSYRAKAAFWAIVNLSFYGLCSWFGGLPGRTSMGIFFALGCALTVLILWLSKPKESNLGTIEARTFEYAVTSVFFWVVWLAPFFVTRQHWWKYVGYGAAGLGGLILLVLILVGISWFASTKAGKAVKHALRVVFVRFPRAIYTVVVGYPRYWYMPENQRAPLVMTSYRRNVEEDASKPWYIYLPYGGLFRRCRIVWGRYQPWTVERTRLGLGGYYLVDEHGARLRIEDVNDGLKAGDAPEDILKDHGIAVTTQETASPTGDYRYGRRSFFRDLLAKQTIQDMLVSLQYHREQERRQKCELQNKIEWAGKDLEKRKLEESAQRLELAKQLAAVAALVKAAPRHKKLGVARRQLTDLITGLAGSEEKAKALLLDALEALEQSESHSN